MSLFPTRSFWISVLVGFQVLRISAFPTTRDGSCRQTKVAILGAGMAGIAATQALSNASITDFLIVERNDYIGGRVAHTNFGKDRNGNPYTVELGANWVQGLGSPGGPENPIWTLAKKWGLKNTYSNYSSIQTYDHTGAVDYTNLLDEYETAFNVVAADAGNLILQNLQDRSARVGFSVADWKPKKDMHAQAAEWWEFDWEYANSPDESSEEFAFVNYNATFNQFSSANNYVWDQRGFNYFITQEAYTFLQPNDPRLLLNTTVTAIDYSIPNSISITAHDGTCITASYAIITFSLGVLPNSIVEFVPAFPEWKIAAIEGMQMGTYTKIFLQFPPSADGSYFWEKTDPNTQFFLYASPLTRGYYPVWQSLSLPDFLPNSGIFFVTVVSSQSYIVENQTDEETKRQVMGVLYDMFGKENVPDPIAFLYPRWSQLEWAGGSYSNWPVGLSLETHQNLRANLENLWFAGEAGSVEYFGFLHGAYFEGQNVGNVIAGCVDGNKTICRDEKRYEMIRGCTTSQRNLSPENDWFGATFATYGL